MYRIELAPGEEALFKSIDEMAAGIANGVITSRARIWHQTSAKWLPIEFHPHYKIALTKRPQSAPKSDFHEPAAAAGHGAFAAPRPIFERPAPSPTFGRPAPSPTFERPAPKPSPYASPAPAPLFEKPAALQRTPDAPLAGAIDTVMRPTEPRPVEVAAVADSVAPFPTPDFIEIHPPRRTGRTWTVGLVAAAAVVVLGGGAALSAFRSSRTPKPSAKPPAASPASYGARPSVTPATPSFGSRAAGSPADSVVTTKAPETPARITDAPRIAAAPKLALGSLGLSDSDRPATDRPSGMTPQALIAHYAAAYDGARAELDRGLRLAGLSSIFAPSRLGAGQVGGARSTVAGAANLLRVYRQRSAAIEQVYRDSINLLTRQIGWTPAQIAVWESRPGQAESPELAALANALLDTIDSALEVLAAHQGGYDVSGGSVVFRDGAPARDYGAARRRLSSLLDGGADAGTPAGRLLKALAAARPPEERVGS